MKISFSHGAVDPIQA